MQLDSVTGARTEEYGSLGGLGGLEPQAGHVCFALLSSNRPFAPAVCHTA